MEALVFNLSHCHVGQSHRSKVETNKQTNN